MCLQLKDFNCRIIEEDIFVYKVLLNEKNKLLSPYQKTPYELNKLYQQKFSFNMCFHLLEPQESIDKLSKMYLDDDRFDLTNCRYCPKQLKTALNVLNGLHSHGKFMDAKDTQQYLLTYALDAVIYEATIPKGSTVFGGDACYYREEYNYVSNQLIVTNTYY